MRFRDFHIHGDNIVECERAFELIRYALSDLMVATAGPSGSAVCPEFTISLLNRDESLHFTFYPGFGRWKQDVLELVRQRGGLLKEAPDVIISRIVSGAEEPGLAIEFSRALPAGNQAWQRNGRAYSFGLARIPYLYVAELGGYELDAQRNRKAPRMPNPAVPFSYISYSLEQETPVLPVFEVSPDADESAARNHADEFGYQELAELTRAIILGEVPDAPYVSLRNKALNLVRNLANSARARQTLTAAQWEQAYSALESGDSLVDFLVANARLAWSKTAYIKALTPTARALMTRTAEFAIGLTSSSLPMCIVDSVERPAFAAAVASLYPDLPQDFRNWLLRDRHLTICWVMGFKPRGDDARPDRGLPPLTRMLVGSEQDLLTVIYGPAAATTWPLLRDNPTALSEQNGLWASILAVSDAILVDSATDQITSHGFLSSHWRGTPSRPQGESIFVEPEPGYLGEHDVDTVLHTLLGRLAGDRVFEGLCNPPGGDWSGLSLCLSFGSTELRWLSLPRVSGDGNKRPDHVFQLFSVAAQPVILAVESKETANSVEREVGPALVNYVRNLIAAPASVERSSPSANWQPSAQNLETGNLLFVSAVAFIPKSDAELAAVLAKSQADIIFATEFHDNGGRVSVTLVARSELGNTVIDYISRIEPAGYGISIVQA